MFDRFGAYWKIIVAVSVILGIPASVISVVTFFQPLSSSQTVTTIPPSTTSIGTVNSECLRPAPTQVDCMARFQGTVDSVASSSPTVVLVFVRVERILDDRTGLLRQGQTIIVEVYLPGNTDSWVTVCGGPARYADIPTAGMRVEVFGLVDGGPPGSYIHLNCPDSYLRILL